MGLISRSRLLLDIPFLLRVIVNTLLGCIHSFLISVFCSAYSKQNNFFFIPSLLSIASLLNPILTVFPFLFLYFTLHLSFCFSHIYVCKNHLLSLYIFLTVFIYLMIRTDYLKKNVKLELIILGINWLSNGYCLANNYMRIDCMLYDKMYNPHDVNSNSALKI